MFELEIESATSAKLKVIGCGGAGGNAVNRMIGAGLRGVVTLNAAPLLDQSFRVMPVVVT